MAVQLLIQGPSAVAAARDLAALPGLSAEWAERPSSGPEKSIEAISVVAEIISIAGGTAALADLIIRWRGRWRSGDSAVVERVVLVVGDERTVLDQLTADGLARTLRRSESPSDATG